MKNINAIGKVACSAIRTQCSLIRNVVITTFLLFSSHLSQAQLSVSGETCVASGTTYTYTLNSGCASSDNVFWCANEGVIVAYGTSCKGSTGLCSISVQWNSSSGSKSIDVHNYTNNTSGNLSVTLASALVAGTISNTTQSINYNATPATINCSAASGGCTRSYQWQQSSGDGNWSDIGGATGQNLSFSSGLTQNRSYRRKVLSIGQVVYSNTAIVYVMPPLSGGTISPTNQNMLTGTASAQLDGTAEGGNCSSSYSYQWLISGNGTDFYPISGATSKAYSPGTMTATKYFRRQVTCGSESVFSSIATVNVYPNLSAGTISPSSATINYNTAPGQLTGSGHTGGLCSGYSYQWQQLSGGSYVDIGSAIATSYTPGNLTATASYRLKIVCGTQTVYSGPVTIAVYPQLQAGSSIPASRIINYNAVPAPFSASGVSGGNGTYTYQWQISSNNSTWTNISGATISSYTPEAITATTYFRVAVTSNGVTAYSSSSVVNVYPPIEAGTISPAMQEVFIYNSNGGQLTLSGVGGGNGTYSYSWFSSPDYETWTPVSGANSTTLTPTNITRTTYYRVYITSNGSHEYSSVAVVKAYFHTGADLNYIRVRDITKPLITSGTAEQALTDPNDVKQSTRYYDGLGRQMQTVSKKISPLQKDIVIPTEYDPFDRETTKYLPYVSGTGDGDYKSNPLAGLNSFYTTLYPDEQYFYKKTDYEASPLNRVLKTYNPGNNWVGNARGISAHELTNTSSDNVRVWNIALTAGSLPGNAGYYTAGELIKNISTNEHGKQVVEYKDKGGKVILKKVQLAASPGADHTGWLCTYYVYDNLDNLRFVLQPKAVELISSNWTVTQPIADELCFRYEYDSRNRMILKQTPGGGATEMVYDKRDRLILSQHANLKAQKFWEVRKYDELNRLIRLGLIYYATATRATHQSAANADINYPVLNSVDAMQENYYDNYNWVPNGVPGIDDVVETTDINSNFFFTAYNQSPEYAQALTPDYTNVRGRLTGTKVRMFSLSGPSVYTHRVILYDKEGRILQTRESNISGGYDYNTIQYDFSGKPLRALHLQYKAGSNARTTRELTLYTYDHAGRILTLKKQIGASAATQRIIASNTYDELGRLKNKDMGSGLEQQDFEYNIRGWQKSMNRDFLSGQSTRYFGYELAYDNIQSVVAGNNYMQSQYDGNIGGLTWKSKGNNELRRYDFNYDAASRLTKADFSQYTGGSFNQNAGVNYNVDNLTYDANGNILSMRQYGLKAGASTVIDNLTYSYLNTNNSNRLASVTDPTDTNSKLGDFKDGNTTGNDYTYDANGNLSSDKNKAISSIKYNHLNTPYEVIMTGKGTISITYNNEGEKLKKVVVDNTSGVAVTTTWLYFKNFVYKNDTLQYFMHEEGVARYDVSEGTPEATKFDFDYFIKDHLGNVRMVLTEEQKTDAYDALTFEDDNITRQNALYDNRTGGSINVAGTRIARPGAFGTTTDNGDYSMLVRKSTGAVGAVKLLKVMSGDQISARVEYFYTAASANNSGASGITSLVANLATALATSGQLGPSHSTAAAINSAVQGDAALAGLLNTPNNTSGGNNAPKSYLNILFFDDQFKVDANASRVYPVAYLPNTKAAISETGLTIPRSGYVYIYFSNESDEMVYFDNFNVTHKLGPLKEETHYYPFGLTMAGISSKAIGKLSNKYGFNGGNELQNKEFSDGSGLELYDAKFRMLDPQIGRFQQIDPLADMSSNLSPFAFSNNNPMLLNDPLGLMGDTAVLPAVIVSAKKKVNDAIDWFTGRNVNYQGSGWGHGPRRWAADQLGLGNNANNLVQLGMHSQLQSSQVNLTGGLLNKVRTDPAMIAFQKKIISLLKSDPRFGKIGFKLNGGEVVEFGGRRWSSTNEDWGALDRNNPLFHSETLDVGTNPLTWSLRHASVDYTATVKTDGTAVISYHLSDRLDLSPQLGRSDAYNNISTYTGAPYHNVLGGNSEMQVNADWQTTIK